MVAGFKFLGKGISIDDEWWYISSEILKSGWTRKIGVPFNNEKHSIFNTPQTFEHGKHKNLHKNCGGGI